MYLKLYFKQLNFCGIILCEVDFMKEILVDEFGYKQFLEELENLKQQSLLISSIGSEEYQNAIGDGWHDNFAYEQAIKKESNLLYAVADMPAASLDTEIICPVAVISVVSPSYSFDVPLTSLTVSLILYIPFPSDLLQSFTAITPSLSATNRLKDV